MEEEYQDFAFIENADQSDDDEPLHDTEVYRRDTFFMSHSEL